MATIEGKTMKYEKGTLLRGISNEYTENFILIESIGMHLRADSGVEAPIYHFLILDKGMKRDWHYVTYVESGSIFVEVAT
jgi:hypothetical protein